MTYLLMTWWHKEPEAYITSVMLLLHKHLNWRLHSFQIKAALSLVRKFVPHPRHVATVIQGQLNKQSS